MKTGLIGGGRVEILDGVAEKDWVVARAGTFCVMANLVSPVEQKVEARLMNFNFSAWSIRNPVPSIVLFLVLCLLGITSFLKPGSHAFRTSTSRWCR